MQNEINTLSKSTRYTPLYLDSKEGHNSNNAYQTLNGVPNKLHNNFDGYEVEFEKYETHNTENHPNNNKDAEKNICKHLGSILNNIYDNVNAYEVFEINERYQNEFEACDTPNPNQHFNNKDHMQMNVYQTLGGIPN